MVVVKLNKYVTQYSGFKNVIGLLENHYTFSTISLKLLHYFLAILKQTLIHFVISQKY